MQLPAPLTDGPIPFENILANRRTVREYASEAMSIDGAAQLLWAAYGITEHGIWNRRTVPSAGAIYPMEIYLIAGDIEEIGPGVYRYDAEEHTLEPMRAGDIRPDLAEACTQQEWMEHAPMAIVICTDFAKATSKYGERGAFYAFFEAGHIAQNIYLQGESMGIGIAEVATFEDEELSGVVGQALNHRPLLVMAAGWKA